MERKKFLLNENDIPQAWYNVIPDMAQKPSPLIHPGTKQPLKVEDLCPLFSKAASEQELNTTERWIEIPDEVRGMYRIWRPTPLVRAEGLEKFLDTPAYIYFKNESVSPVGSHKLNSAKRKGLPTSPPRQVPDSGERLYRLPPSILGSSLQFIW